MIEFGYQHTKNMNHQQFEKYISEAVVALPKDLGDKIENLAFVLEDEPRLATLKERGIKVKGTLLGLYQGIPLTKRSRGYNWVLPDKITIFKNPIQQLAGPDESSIRRLIHQVVHHEIAHYFGMSESKVQDWEKKRQRRKKT